MGCDSDSFVTIQSYPFYCEHKKHRLGIHPNRRLIGTVDQAGVRLENRQLKERHQPAGQHDIACDFDLAGHEGLHAVQAARHHFHVIIGVHGDGHGRVFGFALLDTVLTPSPIFEAQAPAPPNGYY